MLSSPLAMHTTEIDYRCHLRIRSILNCLELIPVLLIYGK